MNETMVNNGTGRFNWSWDSSASFVYGGLAPIFGLICFALVVTACSGCGRRSESEREREAEMNVMRRSVTSDAQIDAEPNILVIVAGEQHPTHLAKPLSSSHNQ
ncbi:hypothetical protein PHAVU_003G181100 [Phaseolus vulgaris]|uniref:Uncharacterized protein n=1 Tax=Phaseolus vulgaris TaxID=3885 RepID=V7CE86_PHAVU|nr:hypothetical protein PHAVU_003G181100g [Phaseolus vulgaris]ESW27186.1 hypothetical protein PHAVU_003G181100g [Phaseolus vulgaris]